jgi:hypothetical protein
MKTNQRLLLSAFLSVTLLILAYGKENSQSPFYILKVRIDPSSHRIEGRAVIKHPPSRCFYLNNNLEISRVIVDGHPVSFHRQTSEYLPYTVGAAVVIDANSGGELLVEYAGTLTGVAKFVNMINPDLVELALYAGWYPMFQGNKLFDFQMDADLPSGFLTTSNGVLTHQQDVKGRNLTRWVSFTPSFDIVLFASAHFQKVEEDQNDMKVEIFFDKMPREYIDAEKDLLIKGFNQLSNFYGPPRAKGILRFVYSPRSGSGYSRIPLSVVSEKYAMSQRHKEFGQARSFHGAAHEMGHFWWSIADANTPDDWINEGLAEFSAYRLSEQYSGKDFADLLVKEYQEHAAQSKTEAAIAETQTTSDDRYVNRYEKTTLLFVEARRRFGQERLDGVFKALYSRFAVMRNATTALFLEEVEKQLGPEAKAFFSEALYRKNLPDKK